MTVLPRPMQSLDDVQHIVYINLASRPDRRRSFAHQMARIGVAPHRYTRFNAIKPPAGHPAGGSLGCSLSHLAVLETARRLNWDHVLIMEDDVLFTDPTAFRRALKGCLAWTAANSGFDVLLLAGNNVGPVVLKHENAVRVTACHTTTAYLVCRPYYDRLIHNVRAGIHHLARSGNTRINSIDVFWHRLQNVDRWFLVTPLTVSQTAGFSDINGAPANYHHVMLTLNKVAAPKQARQMYRRRWARVSAATTRGAIRGPRLFL